ncbi:MAG: malonyl-[acyl-carrier protein] O-methyltransferase BioC, partial [Marinomonas sp.]
MRFSRAAESYDQYAVFQELVLSELMTRFAPNPNDSWVDIGTGTGRALE